MKPNVIILILAILILLSGMFLGGFIERNFIAEPCLELVKSDIKREVKHDSATVKAVVKSQPKKVAKYKFTPKQKHGAQKAPSGTYNGAELVDSIGCPQLLEITRELITLADTSFYSDTLRNDTSHSIVVNDTIVGHRIGLGVEFKNLRPLVKETVTNTVVKKVKPQIYLGAIVGLNNKANNFLAAPSVAVSYKAALLNYSFDIKNQMHMVGGYVRVFGK